METNHSTGLMTVQQLSEHLQVPVGTIYYWVSRREIPFIKMNRLVRFDLKEVLKHFNIATHDSDRRPAWR